MIKETSSSVVSLEQLENLLLSKTYNTNWLHLEEFHKTTYEELLEVLNSLEEEPSTNRIRKEGTGQLKPQMETLSKQQSSSPLHTKNYHHPKDISTNKAIQSSLNHQKSNHSPASQRQSTAAKPTIQNREVQFDPLVATNLDSLKFRVKNCTWCKLCDERKAVVFGQGNQQADIMFIGDKPEKGDDSRGMAFWGNSGKLLTQMIQSIGINRDAVYITNTIKCRPPSDRDPLSEEITTCQPILNKQIELLKPRLIIALGQNCLNALLGQNTPLETVRGKYLKHMGIPLLATYHPNDIAKEKKLSHSAWNDFRRIRQFMSNLGLNPLKSYLPKR